MTFKKWAKKTWDGKARRRNLFKAALKLNMVDSGLSVAEYLNKFQDNLRLSGKFMSQDYYAQGWIKTRHSEGCYLHQVWHSGRSSRSCPGSGSLRWQRKEEIAPPYKTRLVKTSRPAKVERIDLTAAVTDDRVKVVCEYCPRPGHEKYEYCIYLATKNFCSGCQVSGHTIYFDCLNLLEGMVRREVLHVHESFLAPVLLNQSQWNSIQPTRLLALERSPSFLFRYLKEPCEEFWILDPL